MPRTKKTAASDSASVAEETASEVSKAATAAGIRLTEQDAAWAANKLAQRRKAVELVRTLPYARHEPAPTLNLRRDG